MRCLCEHYMETDNGWCCLERQRLRDENAELREKLARAKAEIKRLRAERVKTPMEAQFEEGAPSSQRLKKTSPEELVARKGGAKKGHEAHCRCAATEETADEVREAEAPAVCPHCHGALQEMPPRERTVVDLEEPRRREVVWRLGQRWCSHCRRVVRARPAGVLPKKSASNAALATLAQMLYVEMVTAGAVSRMTWINKGTLLGMMASLAELLEPCLEAIKASVCASHVVHADETVWRCDGRGGYAWVFLGEGGVLLLCRTTRSGQVAVEALGSLNKDGVLVTDRYSGYLVLAEAARQLCFEHLKRDLLKLERKNPHSEECKRFVAAVLPLLKEAMALRRTEKERDRYLTRAREIRDAIMERMRKGRCKAVRKYQEIFLNNEESLFRWVEDPAVPAENNAAERAVRPLAVARKVSHGSQGEGGLRTREVLGSVLLTLRLRHGRDAWKVLVGALDKLAADPKTDIVRELFPEYDPDKEDSAKAARPA